MRTIDIFKNMSWGDIVALISAVVTAIGTLLTALGVFLARKQLRLAKQQAVTQFEDNLSREYRDIARGLPTRFLLGEGATDQELGDVLDKFYHYIDLTNEQIFLRQTGRLSADTWENWRDGIRANLKRPAFVRAWKLIRDRAPESFDGLRRLEESGYEDDPADWGAPASSAQEQSRLRELGGGDEPLQHHLTPDL